jgi:CRISPR-associated protein Cmr1
MSQHSPFPIYRFRFRVVTPLFLGGADPDRRAELRPPSIKGVLRDWYRLLVGLEQAVEKEAQLFGGSAAGAGQSPFLLAIDRPLLGEEPWEPPRGDREGISGLGYLGYSLKLGRNDRKAIPAEKSFELEAAFPRGGDDEQHAALRCSVWLLAHLGGLGTRSRRGFGSLSLEEWLGPDEDRELSRLPLLATAPDAQSAGRSLRRGMEALRQWAPGITEGSSPDSRPLGFQLAGARFLVVRGPNRAGAWDRAGEALEHVGAAMQRFRRQPLLDGFASAQMLARGERLPKAPGRAAFGLPLSYRTRKGTDTLEPYLPGDPKHGGRGQEYRRLPSPLLFHVQQTRGGFVPVVTLLAGAWPGRDVPVHVRGRGCPADPENQVLEAFLDRLVDDGAEEVKL